MITAAVNYSGVAFLLAARLVTAVLVLVEHRDDDPDPHELDHRIRRCTHPPLTRKDHR